MIWLIKYKLPELGWYHLLSLIVGLILGKVIMGELNLFYELHIVTITLKLH